MADDSDDAVGRIGSAFRTVATIAPPITLATALLFYFGWARSDAEARALGFDESVLGMSTRDYMLRSIDALFLPLALTAVAVLGWLWLSARVEELVDRETNLSRIRRVAQVLCFGWLIVPVLCGLLAWLLTALNGPLDPPHWQLLVPLGCAIGVLVTVYGVSLVGRVDARLGRPRAPRSTGRQAVTITCVGILVTMALFWEVSQYATAVGYGRASLVEADLLDQPAVTVYSPKRLALEAPGVVESAVADPDTSSFGYRYTGLRFLQRAGGRYFLLSDGWTLTSGTVTVLPDDDSVRLEFTR